MIRTDRGSRGLCPGSHACAEGSLTVEAASGVVLLTIATALLAGVLAVGAIALGLTAHARDAARIAALQPDRGHAEAALRALVGPETDTLITSDGVLVSVELRRRVTLGRVAAFTLRAHATAVEETPW